MSVDPRTPVIVGAAQVLHRDERGEELREPIALMVDALRSAAADSGTGDRLLRRADSVRCVPVIGWRYRNAAALVAEDLDVRPRQTVQSALIGGEGGQLLINDTARAIASSEVDVALVAGAEAIASIRAAQREGRELAWRRQPQQAQPTRTLGEDRPPGNDAEAGVGLTLPVYMYALLEGAIRRAAEDPPDGHLARLAELWSRMSAVAAGNPHAWIRRAYSADEIATPTSENRPVTTPYTKLLTANIQVNMGSGLIVASAKAARDAGVPRDRWVFIHAGAQAQDEWCVSERNELAFSPAINALGKAALAHAGVAVDEIAHLDLYSCFPAAVEIAARELGVAIDDPARTLTVTGGLTFAGGPGNNYSSHAVATLTELLRADPDAYGLVTAVGWYLTKHALGIYCGRPPRKPFASLDPEPRHPPSRRASADYLGPATLETYTVAYEREGTPEAAIVSGLTPDGHRALMRTSRPEVIDALLSADPLGWTVDMGAGGHLTLGQPARARRESIA